MINWLKMMNLQVFKKLRLEKGTIIEVVNADGSVTQVTLAQEAFLSGVVPGTAAATKALVLDANLNIAGINNISGMTGLFNESATNGLTAFAGGGQASALQLTTELNRVTVVATAGDSVKLPSATAGLTIVVINKSANPMQVFGLGADQIDGIAAATGVSQMQSSMVIYSCSLAGQWDSEGLATGYSGSYQTQSTKNAITAHAGGTQAAAIADPAAQLPSMINRVTVCATGGDSTVLPVSVPGMTITVINAGAASMNLFPQVGEQINALGNNTAFAVGIGKTATLFCAVALQWHAVLSA